MKKLFMVLSVAGLLLLCTALATARIHTGIRHHIGTEHARPTPPRDVPPPVMGLRDVHDRVALPWSDDLESGGGAWTTTGFFHVQADPQNLLIMNPTINPRLVSLPDNGQLPAAHSGNHALWYGEECTGTFIGCDFDQNQPALSGGTSVVANTGYAITPQLDLSGLANAQLSFWTWWEIEGVDADRFDMMYMEISTDGGASWLPIGGGSLNPIVNPHSAPNVPYTAGGVGAPGMWQQQQFDLTPFVGNQAWIRFRFDTRDQLYNGFRGWFIDDVQVTATAASGPVITQVTPGTGHPGDPVAVIGDNFQNGAAITVGGLTASSSVVSSTLAEMVIPALGPGHYDVVLTNPDNQFATCGQCFEVTTVPGPQILTIDPDHQVQGPGISVTIHGHYFDPAAAVLIGGLPVTNLVVVSADEITCTTPDNLGLGSHPVRVTNPDGQFDLCVGCFEVDDSPCQFPYTEVDMGDLSACGYPTLVNNPGHALTGIAWLGAGVDGEAVPHTVPTGTDLIHNSSLQAHMDNFEDGVAFFGAPWTPCTPVSIIVQVTAGPNFAAYEACGGHLYLNGWKDGNGDYSFDDVLCDGQAPEWIVQDALVTPGYHTFTFMDPGVSNLSRYNGIFRFRLTHQPVGQYGYGMATTECPDMPNGTFGFDNILGEDEDYVMCDLQLSVELTSFEAQSGDNAVALRWSTASETQNDHFEL
ncbi:MAG TPA: IPT/TIG domain-containing protein, partial [bacterium]